MYAKDIKKKGSGQMSRNEMEIRIEGLEKYYGKKHALKNVTLTIPSGMFGLLGRNGAGKTTLMKVIATLIGKQGGRVTVCGIPVEEAARIRKITGYLPQEFSMYPNMGVYEAMDYLGALSKMPKKERKERIPVLLEKVNLQDHYRTKIRALSGGMKRRLGIAQAILHDPKVLIVDEPTAGLDPEERVRFRNLLCEIAEDRIVILSTHIVGDIEATCEQIAIMDEGEIYYNGTVMELLQMTEGKVYTAQISRKDLAKMKEKYVLTSMLTQGNNVMVRFLSEQKPQVEASVCEPGVEDAYMYLMQEKEGFSHVLDLV